jgi:DNA-binding response OmpR family regulator
MTKVLVADDDTDNRALMSAVLTSMGVDVVTASTGDAALAAAGDRDLNAVLLDVRMPGMSGLEVCEAMRAAGLTDIPILLISACAAPEEIQDGLAAGADDYLVKPFRISDFVGRVSALLDTPRPAVSPALSAALAARGALARSGRWTREMSSAIG